MTIAFLRATHVAPDPRVEKEVNSVLLEHPKILILGWDRAGDLPRDEILRFPNGQARILRSRIRSSYGASLYSLLGMALFQVFLLRQLWKHRKDISAIHASDLGTALSGLIMAKILRVPLVYDIYDYFVDSFSVPGSLVPVIESIDTFVINRADVVIIVSENRESQLAKANPKRLLVIHNSPPATEVVPNGNLEQTGKRFVYVGILSEGRLLAEIVELFSRRPDWHLDIGGFGGLEPTISKYAAEFENITFHGRLPYAETLKLEAEADCLLAVYDPAVPNHKYSSPNKFYEALMLGLPIIVAGDTGVDALVSKHQVGMVCEYSAASFEQAAEELFSEPRRLAEIQTRARALFETTYSWEIMEQRLLSMYQSITQPAGK